MSGRRPRKTHCRCRACGARQVKAMHPSDYIRPPRCRSCGKKGTLRPDKCMNNRWRTQHNCTRTGYWFIHRRGSKYCHFRANGEDRLPGDLDFHDRYLERTYDKEQYEERAAILEFEAGFSREEAERRALTEVTGATGEGSLRGDPDRALDGPLPVSSAAARGAEASPVIEESSLHQVPPPATGAESYLFHLNEELV